MEALDQPTVSSVSVLDLYESLRDQGYLTEADCADVLQARSELMQVEGRWPAETVHRLWQLAISRGAEGHVGVTVGERLKENYRGMLSNLIISAGNLGEVVRLFERYLPVMSQVDVVTVEPVAAGLRLSYGFVDPRFYHSLSVGRSMSAAVAWARYLTGEPVTPLEAGFQVDAVSRPEVYHRMFGPHCRFGVAEDYLVLSAADLELPLRHANRYVHTLIRDRVEDVRRSLARGTPVSLVARKVIEDDLHLGAVNSSHVAGKLNISRQTLHRKLRGEGLNFRSLIADVRRERAKRYLEQGLGKVEHLSGQLGYSEPSAFFKAFRGWFGCSPRQFAERRTGKAPG